MTASDSPVERAAWTTTFNTVTVDVARPVRAVWALFHDRPSWMESFTACKFLHGAYDIAGSLACVTTVNNGVQYERFEQTLHVEPERRIVVKIWAAWTAIATHADFQFRPAGACCRLTVSIHCWLPASIAGEAAELQAATQKKIETDFAHLRSVAEAHA